MCYKVLLLASHLSYKRCGLGEILIDVTQSRDKTNGENNGSNTNSNRFIHSLSIDNATPGFKIPCTNTGGNTGISIIKNAGLNNKVEDKKIPEHPSKK